MLVYTVKDSVITVGILQKQILPLEGFVKKCLRELTECLTLGQFPQKSLTNPSELRIYLSKISSCDHRNCDSVNLA